jgi:molybdopterin/thiamine biosynthesis adenylyltransferase
MSTAAAQSVVSEDRFARLKGFLPRSLASAHIVIVGAGSVGSQLADGLARAGVGHFTIIDPDKVEPANLSRTVYRAADVGKDKASSLAGNLKAIDTAIEVEALASKLQDTKKDLLKRVFASADLIIGAADDVVAQILLNRISQRYHKPAMFVGIYARAAGGEVALSVPGLSACFECYVGGVRTDNGVERKINYGTGRLDGEVALGSDIQHVTSGALKIGLSLLSALSGDPEAKAGAFVLPLFVTKQTVALFGMEPQFFLFPELLRGAYAQYAFQSAWLTVHRKHNCPACSGPLAEDPIDAMAVSISKDTRAGLRNQIAGKKKETANGND